MRGKREEVQRSVLHRVHPAGFSQKSLTVRSYSSWNPPQAFNRFFSYKVTKSGIIAPADYKEKTTTLLKEHVKESWESMNTSEKILVVETVLKHVKKYVKYGVAAASGGSSLVLVHKYKDKFDATVKDLAAAKQELKVMQDQNNKLSVKVEKLEAEVKVLQIINKMWQSKGFGAETSQDEREVADA